jgi:SNF2 family DNA or RNA helicase
MALLGRLGGGEVVEWGLSRFLGALGDLQEWLEWPVAEWLEALQFLAAPFSVRVELEGDLRSLEASVGISYGVEDVGFPRVEGNRVWVKDANGEAGVWRRLERAGFVERGGGKWGLVGEERVMHFVTHELPELEREWSIESGRRFRSVSQQVVLVRPNLEIRGSGEDWLRFDLKFQTSDGKQVSAAEIRQLLRHGNRGQAGSGGRRLVVSADVEELIDPLFSELDLRQEGGSYVASRVAGELVEEIRKKLDNRHNLSGFEDLFTFDKPEAVRASLRPYQEQGAGWLEDRVRKYGGALLADDMGLGKTLQTIALIERLFFNPEGGDGVGGGGEIGRVGGGSGGDVLVVATASLLGNWRGEFGRFAPGREVRVLHGAGREVERERVVEGGGGVVWLTSFGTLARDLAWHLKREYRAVVVDEASLMRNPDTDHAKALFKLRARARVALTGTPVENGVRDLWSIFRFIQPGWLGSREEFRERYELPLADPGSAGGVMRRLRFKASPFVLRRTKEQVAADLPSKLVVDEFCELSPDQVAVYRQLLEEGRKQVEVLQDQKQAGAARMRMLTVLLRLRQTCCDLALLKNDRFNQLLVGRRSSKLERLLELLNEAVSGDHRVLVFSQFQTQLREIEKCLEVAGIGSLRLDGQTRNRQDLVDRFQKADGPPVFLISLKAGGYGLNLTAADTVIHFDPWWNPAAEAQASDRAHRIGQTRPVTVYRLLTRGTVEEKVVRMQERKRELAGVVDEDGTGDAAGWSEGDLMEMIRG